LTSPSPASCTIFAEHAFWQQSGGRPPEDERAPRTALSGTQVRAMLTEGRDIPVEFTRPEIARILMETTRTKVSA
jgi:ATP sulfurylase